MLETLLARYLGKFLKERLTSACGVLVHNISQLASERRLGECYSGLYLGYTFHFLQ